jgi:hypothetical protein
MKWNPLFKTAFLVSILFVVNSYIRGQATLPFNYDNGNPSTDINGLTQFGLGRDYSTSPHMKFDASGDYLILNFTGIPGILSFKIKWNQGSTATRFPGLFTLLESGDGITYTTVQLYDSTKGTDLKNATTSIEVFSALSPATRYIKWIYSSKTNGNIGIGAISLTAGINPVLNISTNTLKGFTYITGLGPSSEQSFTVSGSSLNNNIVLTPPSDFELSKGSGASFVPSNPVTLTNANGIVAATTIYSRLKTGLKTGNYTENISVSSVGSNINTITCSGSVTAIPTITLFDITNPTLSTVQGSSVSQTVNVSGVNLSADVGLSISGPDAGLFLLSQYSVSPSAGNVPNTVVTITYSPKISGTNSATIMMSSTGAMPVIRTLNGISSIATENSSLKTSFIITVENDNILFLSDAGETVEIYNPIGQKIIQKLTVEGMNTIHVSEHGVLILKVGNKVTKLIL